MSCTACGQEDRERAKFCAGLIEETGARTLAPMLCEWRAELAQVQGERATRAELLRAALQGYRETGAVGHAERLASEPIA